MAVKELGHSATSYGWRKRTADFVAPRLPMETDRVRTLLGMMFFASSLRYIVRTIRRAST